MSIQARYWFSGVIVLAGLLVVAGLYNLQSRRTITYVQTDREYVDSRDSLLRAEERGFFLGTILSKGSPVAVRYPLGTALWTPYMFRIDSVVKGSRRGEVEGEVVELFLRGGEHNGHVEVHRSEHPINIGDHLAIGLSYEVTKPDANFPTGYFALEPAVFYITTDGRVSGGGDRLAAMNISVDELLSLIES